jgi:hypothetical protein
VKGSDRGLIEGIILPGRAGKITQIRSKDSVFSKLIFEPGVSLIQRQKLEPTCLVTGTDKLISHALS